MNPYPLNSHTKYMQAWNNNQTMVVTDVGKEVPPYEERERTSRKSGWFFWPQSYEKYCGVKIVRGLGLGLGWKRWNLSINWLWLNMRPREVWFRSKLGVCDRGRRLVFGHFEGFQELGLLRFKKSLFGYFFSEKKKGEKVTFHKKSVTNQKK